MREWRSSPRPGFTLIELLIVIALITIMASLTLPRLNMGRFRADAAMRVVQAVLQQAQRAAIQRQSDVIVSFDTANARIRIVYDATNDHEITSTKPTWWKGLEEGSRFVIPPSGLNGTVEAAIVGPNVTTSTDGYPTVYYRRDGAVSTSFDVYLQSSDDNPNNIRALTVNQATGRAELYHYGGDTWQRRN